MHARTADPLPDQDGLWWREPVPEHKGVAAFALKWTNWFQRIQVAVIADRSVQTGEPSSVPVVRDTCVGFM
jgi:hypothetical protein